MFGQVVGSEFLKLHRSRITWFTLVALSLGPLGGALFMWILREPGRAAQLGLLGAKANLAGLAATWPGYMALVTQFIGAGGMLLLSFIVAFVFGREYARGHREETPGAACGPLDVCAGEIPGRGNLVARARRGGSR